VSAVSEKVILEAKTVFDRLCDQTLRDYKADCLRERIKILEDMGAPDWGLLGELRAELLSIILSR
jgi:flagellar biosynthesis regulator FlaF